MKIVEKCQLCSDPIKHPYNPMKSWDIEGPLCGKCYSKKIHDHYPGTHERMKPSDEK